MAVEDEDEIGGSVIDWIAEQGGSGTSNIVSPSAISPEPLPHVGSNASCLAFGEAERLADGPDLLQEIKKGAQRLYRFFIGQAKQYVALGRSADVGDGRTRRCVGDPSRNCDTERGGVDAPFKAGFEDFEGIFGQG